MRNKTLGTTSSHTEVLEPWEVLKEKAFGAAGVLCVSIASISAHPTVEFALVNAKIHLALCNFLPFFYFFYGQRDFQFKPLLASVTEVPVFWRRRSIVYVLLGYMVWHELLLELWERGGRWESNEPGRLHRWVPRRQSTVVGFSWLTLIYDRANTEMSALQIKRPQCPAADCLARTLCGMDRR